MVASGRIAAGVFSWRSQRLLCPHPCPPANPCTPVIVRDQDVSRRGAWKPRAWSHAPSCSRGRGAQRRERPLLRQRRVLLRPSSRTIGNLPTAHLVLSHLPDRNSLPETVVQSPRRPVHQDGHTATLSSHLTASGPPPDPRPLPMTRPPLRVSYNRPTVSRLGKPGRLAPARTSDTRHPSPVPSRPRPSRSRSLLLLRVRHEHVAQVQHLVVEGPVGVVLVRALLPEPGRVVGGGTNTAKPGSTERVRLGHRR